MITQEYPLEKINDAVYYTEYYYISSTAHISDFMTLVENADLNYLKTILPKDVLLKFFTEEDLI